MNTEYEVAPSKTGIVQITKIILKSFSLLVSIKRTKISSTNQYKHFLKREQIVHSNWSITTYIC